MVVQNCRFRISGKGVHIYNGVCVCVGGGGGGAFMILSNFS